VLTRRTKADFSTVYWHRHSRAFAASWPGTGIDASLVDADRLRKTWADPAPPAASELLAQYTWLQADHVPPDHASASFDDGENRP
jgi:hypothetical protein